MDNVGMIQFLQHPQLIVNHLFVASNIFLQDNLNGDLARAGVCFAHDTIRPCAQRLS